MEDGNDNVSLPKVPARKLSSHNYVVQFKKNQFEAHNRHKFNNEDSQQNNVLYKNKMTNSNRDIKSQQPFEGDNGDEGDEKNNFNWRPLRDFF